MEKSVEDILSQLLLSNDRIDKIYTCKPWDAYDLMQK